MFAEQIKKDAPRSMINIRRHQTSYLGRQTSDLGRPYLAVSSSPRLWIDVFALAEKSNMAATESDPDSKVRKMSITFY